MLMVGIIYFTVLIVIVPIITAGQILEAQELKALLRDQDLAQLKSKSGT